MSLCQIPDNILNDLLIPKYLETNDNTLDEKISLIKTYRNLDLVKNQINYHYKEYNHIQKFLSKDCDLFYKYVLEKHKGKSSYLIKKIVSKNKRKLKSKSKKRKITKKIKCKNII